MNVIVHNVVSSSHNHEQMASFENSTDQRLNKLEKN